MIFPQSSCSEVTERKNERNSKSKRKKRYNDILPEMEKIRVFAEENINFPNKIRFIHQNFPQKITFKIFFLYHTHTHTHTHTHIHTDHTPQTHSKSQHSSQAAESSLSPSCRWRSNALAWATANSLAWAWIAARVSAENPAKFQIKFASAMIIIK